MNNAILGKVLTAIVPVTDMGAGAVALDLKMRLDTIAKDPNDAGQLDAMIAGAVCNDYKTFEAVAQFVALCLLQGDKNNLDMAVNKFAAIARAASYNL